MTCRAPTCAGSSPTGAQLTYDAERRLASWQNAPTNPTSQAWFLYDGEGHRVEQDVSGGSGNHTYYLPGNVEEVTPSGTLVKYYSAGGLALGLNTTSDSSGSDISYLVSDGLGSVSEALAQTGTASGIQLYSPYDTVRYSSGVMPTAKGYTGQRADSTTGLDYYGARYYDPTVGQFTSADTLLAGGLNRYGYVGGNPETLTDPSGHVEDGLHFDLEGSITGNGAGGLAGLARVILDWVFSPLAGGVLVAAATHQSATTTTTSASLAGTPDTATTFTVNGAAVSVLPSGDIVVTTSGSGGTTTTAYATGSAGWLQWTHDIDVAYADTDVWNARTAPRAVAATSSGSGAGTGSGSGAGTGSGASNPSAANPSANAGAAVAAYEAFANGSKPPQDDDPCSC